jgi:hypothetical protein
MLNELSELPEGLLSLPADALHEKLGGPTLIHLTGQRQPALFVSVLMHGNENVGWEAVRRLLQKYTAGGGEQSLPRSLSLFIGNTAAAAENMRHLPNQPDYNRVWPGTELPYTEEHGLLQEVVDSVVSRGLFASVDVHNNTGLNPHYACLNAIRTESLHLAAMFSRTVVYFIRPVGVQSIAMTEFCPSVTLECGKVGQPHGVEHAVEYLDACLHLAEHPQHPISHGDIDLFHTVAIVKVPSEVSFGFGCDNRDLCLLDDLEHLNFRELPSGTSFGLARSPMDIPFDVLNEEDMNVGGRYFELDETEIKTLTPLMPSMLTRDETVIRQDCLCYLMERYDAHLTDAEHIAD